MRTVRPLLYPALVLAFVANLFAAPITIWVPPYGIGTCKTMVQRDFGGVGMKDVVTYLPLQFWVPSGGASVSKVSYVSDNDVYWFRDWAHANGVKVLLCLYNATSNGWDWNLALSSFKNNKDAFVNSLVAEVNRLGLDGVDIDLEGPGDYNSDKGAFVAFATLLAEKLHAQGDVVTMATFANQYNAPNWDWWPELENVLDGIATMGYDWSGRNSSYQDQVNHSNRWETFMIGMPGWVGKWQGDTLYDQLDWVIEQGTVGMAIWDAQLESSAWQQPAVWQKMLTIAQSGNGPYTVSATATHGSVTFSPDKDEYAKGDVVTLTATPDEGYVFAGWGGSYGSNPSITVTVERNMALTANFASTGELILNGDFSDGATSWNFGTYNGGEGSGAVVNGEYCVTLVTGKPEAWSLQLKQEKLAIVKDSVYTLQFVAWADAAREMEIKVGRASSPWTRYSGLDSTISLTTEPQLFTIIFTMEEATDMVARLEFNGGFVGSNWYVDDVSLKMGEPDPTPNLVQKPNNNSSVGISGVYTVGNTLRFNAVSHNRVNIKVYDFTGKTVLNCSPVVKQGANVLPLMNLAKGLYVVSIDQGQSAKRVPVVIR